MIRDGMLNALTDTSISTVMTLNTLLLGNQLLGIVLLVSVLSFDSWLLSPRLANTLELESPLVSFIVAFAFVLFLIGVVGGLLVDVYELPFVFQVGLLIGLSAAIALLSPRRFPFHRNLASSAVSLGGRLLVPSMAFFALIVLGFLALAAGKTNGNVSAIWTQIPSVYIWIFGSLTLFVSFLILTDKKHAIVLTLVSAYSLMRLSYMSMTTPIVFNGDLLRLAGYESTILSGRPYGYTLFQGVGLGPGWNSYPVFLLTKIVRVNQVALSAFIGQFSNLDMLQLNRWMGPVLWGVLAPVILYGVGSCMKMERRDALLLAFMPSLFYFPTIFGAQITSSSLGTFFFLISLLFWVCYLRRPIRSRLILSSAITVAMYVGYPVSFFLSASTAILCLALTKTKPMATSRGKVRLVLLAEIVAALSFVLPMLDTLYGSGLSTASLSGITEFGTALINGIKSLTGVSVLISPGRWIGTEPWFMVGMQNANPYVFGTSTLRGIVDVSIWVLVGLGVSQAAKKTERSIFLLLVSLLIITNLDTVIVYFFMTGPHVVGERLDLPRELFMGFFAAWGIGRVADSTERYVLKRPLAPRTTVRRFLPSKWSLIALAICVLVTVGTVSTYTLGTVSTSISVNEYNVAKSIVQSQNSSNKTFCVLADERIYLSLEYLSGETISDINYTATFHYYVEMLDSPSLSYLYGALSSTRSDVCYFVVPVDSVTPTYLKYVSSLSSNSTAMGSYYLFKITKFKV
jgi:hypothetical protein